MDQQQQREIARGLREGKTDAWRALYDAYAGPVWRWVARLMGGESADVGDVVQETFLAAARSARKYDASRGPLWGWLIGIARNQVALNYRKRQRHDRLRETADGAAAGHDRIIRWLAGREPPPAEAIVSAETTALVRVTLTELPSGYGALLTAKYCDGASVEQLAHLEDCSNMAVRSKLARARRAFRRAFTETCTTSPDPHSEGQP
ncbi:MAG: sigma-70 family RNA polymerase sigma factor [Candidatus Nealsonbacteria bacterium]|nr:sigma-70 family RNA polymerase sigma factor [Candidatus Nealsonbacteria bacterium]